MEIGFPVAYTSHLPRILPTYFCCPALIINRVPFQIGPGLKISHMVTWLSYSKEKMLTLSQISFLLSSTPYHIIFSDTEIIGYCFGNDWKIMMSELPQGCWGTPIKLDYNRVSIVTWQSFRTNILGCAFVGRELLAIPPS